MSEWSVQVLDDGGRCVIHHAYETCHSSEIDTFLAKVTLEDLVVLLLDRAADGDFILVSGCSPVVALELLDVGQAGGGVGDG